MITADTSPSRLAACQRFLESVRHSMVLGLEVLSAEEYAVRVRIPWRADLVGNPDTDIMHGGAIFAMMDQAGGMAVTCRTFPAFEITPTIDFRVDHLHGPAPGTAVVCEATCYRLTTHVAFVRITAWQEGREDEPVAAAQATYTRLQINTTNNTVSQ